MGERITVLERAFELARSGKFANLEGIFDQLHREGYGTGQLVDSALWRQLQGLMSEARHFEVRCLRP